jgi:uncharacterized phage infection (PIP) family protein YhgE
MARDLKEAIENFKSVARPFQAMLEVVEQLDAAATDIRSVKDLESRKATLVKEQEDAITEAKEVRTKAKADVDQKISDAETKAEQIVVEARKTAESVLESAQRKASAVDNESNSMILAARHQVDELTTQLESTKEELAKVDKLAEEAEKRLMKAQASISKLLEG